MRERRLELRELQDFIEVKSKLNHQDYFTFAQAAQLMGVSRQHIYKLVKMEGTPEQVAEQFELQLVLNDKVKLSDTHRSVSFRKTVCG